MTGGRLVRIRRGWVATIDADPVLVASARAGVVVTCISQAARLGLWVHETPKQFHVGADPKSAGGKSERARVHWSKPTVPRHPDALVDPIENVLASMADCEPFERALATWESALNRLVLQADGRHHVGAQRSEDIRHDAELRRLMGYHVTPRQLSATHV